MGYYAYRLHKGVVDYAVKHDWILDASMTITGKIPENWQGDGIISYHCERDDIIDKIKQANVPVVDLGLPSKKLTLPTVHHDNVAIGRMAASHLISQGFQDIAYLWCWYGKNDNERRQGLKEKVMAEKRNFYDLHENKLATELEQLPRPLAIMAQNDYLALELVNRLIELGVKVPEEVAVIGADNDGLYAGTSIVPLTSVDDNVEGCGFKAAELLGRMMDGEKIKAEPTLIPPVKVVVRESTDILAIAHRPTLRALQTIREEFQRPISLELLAEDCGMCRRRLEDHFKKYVGRTMSMEIQRLRLQLAEKLLCETDLKINAIADECGFTDAPHLNKLFTRQFSATPQAYRLKKLARK